MKPILFNTDMVRAILAGRKSVTRRVVKPQPFSDESGRRGILPYRPGEILYVRETWCHIFGRYVYRADFDEITEEAKILFRPSIHMPREAARIFLWVTSVRVERLQEITELDILEKEGATVDFPQPKPSYMSLAYTETRLKPAIRKSFADLWNSTIKKADRGLYNWEANPWVWVIEFDRISREEAAHNVCPIL